MDEIQPVPDKFDTIDVRIKAYIEHNETKGIVKMQLTRLSKRERQVFQHLNSDKTQQEIADQLFVCVRTIKFHCGNIYKKLQVRNRQELRIKLTQDNSLSIS